MAKETHIKTDKNPVSPGVLGSYLDFHIVVAKDRRVHPTQTPNFLALQLHFLLMSDSMSFHESEVMDDRYISRGNA